jgi:hypothetical protein
VSLHFIDFISWGVLENGPPELFGRPSPSPKISDFKNHSDSDSACLFVYAFIL